MAATRAGVPVNMSGLQSSEVNALREEMDFLQDRATHIVSSVVRSGRGRCGLHVALTQGGRTVTKHIGSSTRWRSSGVRTEGDNRSSCQARLTNGSHALVGYIESTVATSVPSVGFCV